MIMSFLNSENITTKILMRCLNNPTIPISKVIGRKLAEVSKSYMSGSLMTDPLGSLTKSSI